MLRSFPLFERGLRLCALDAQHARTLQDAFSERQREAESALKRLARFVISNDDVQKEFAAAQAQVLALETAATAVQLLAGEIASLRRVQKDAEALLAGSTRPMEGADVLPDRPRVFLTVDKVLAGDGLTLDALDQARVLAGAQIGFLMRWGMLFRNAQEEQAWRDRVGPPRLEGEADQLAGVDVRLRRVWWMLLILHCSNSERLNRS
jgi:hypothetical protein